MASTLIITNDFPPRIGGIESFVSDICELLDFDVVVYASGPPGGARSDDDRGYPVIRDGSLLLPTRRLADRTADVLRRWGATRVIFGAAAPLGLLAPRSAAGRCATNHCLDAWPRDVVGGTSRLPPATAPDRRRLRSSDGDLQLYVCSRRRCAQRVGPCPTAAPPAPRGHHPVRTCIRETGTVFGPSPSAGSYPRKVSQRCSRPGGWSLMIVRRRVPVS